jgi:hypothetical protein
MPCVRSSAAPPTKFTVVLQQHWTDHSQTLPKAVVRAHERTWQALGIALAGNGFRAQVSLIFASADAAGLRHTPAGNNIPIRQQRIVLWDVGNKL